MRVTPKTFTPRFDVQLAQFDTLTALLDSENLDALDPAARDARLGELREQARLQIEQQVQADIAAQRAAHDLDQAARAKALTDVVAKAESAASAARAAADDARALLDGIDDPDVGLVHRLEALNRSMGA